MSTRIELESKGIKFDMHTLNHHNLYDYISYILRLRLKHHSEFNDDDLYMWECYQKKQIKWAPVKNTIYMGKWHLLSILHVNV